LQTKGNQHGCIFWLDGVAGTGKSTIAQTVAGHFDETHELGASFFCSRDDADCSNIGLLFPTIAYQLALFNPSFQTHLSDVMHEDPHVQSALAPMQLEKLIINPLHAAKETFQPCIIVIDALDECKDENATSTILSALSVFASQCFPLKFLITSRPVVNVMEGFRSTGLMKDTNALVLHSIPPDISEKDIRIYLEYRLSRIAQRFRLKSWPPRDEVTQLVEQSRGLFIFAATVANFIEDPNRSNPKQRLRTMLSTTYVASPATSPHKHLDSLYLGVLQGAFPQIDEAQQADLQMVLGTIVLLLDPLDAESLEALLDLEEGMVRSTLLHLHSIAIVPDTGNGPVRLMHPSFHDFLIDNSRCNNTQFVVNAQHRHTSLAECCLRVLQTLSPDICKIGDPSVLNQEVDLPVRISTYIPAHVRYACRHWAAHLSRVDIHDTILALFLDFCSNCLLNWLEVMSLLGELDGAMTALQSAHKRVDVSRLKFSVGSINLVGNR